MPALFHYFSCRYYRVFDIGYPCHSTRIQVATVHDGGIHFIDLVIGKHCALAGIEERRIFQHPDGSLDRIETAAVRAEMIDAATGKTKVRLVDVRAERYAIARRYMIRLRRDDFEDPHELAKFAATAGLSLEAFRSEFEYLIQLEPPPLLERNVGMEDGPAGAARGSGGNLTASEGAAADGSIDAMDEATWDLVLAINVKGVAHGCSFAARSKPEQEAAEGAVEPIEGLKP